MTAPGILSQGNGYTIYAERTAETSVPYKPSVHQEGENFGFVDLTERPDAIKMLPEALGKPGLISLLATVNGPTSPFMSLGCMNAIFELGDQQLASEVACYVGSYLQVAYREPQLGTLDAITRLAGTVVNKQDQAIWNWVQLELGVEPLISFFGTPGVHCLNLKIIAYGRDEANAWECYNYACSQCAAVFSEVIAKGVLD